jgi:hypothetical protein
MSRTYDSSRQPQRNPHDDMGPGMLAFAGLGALIYFLASGAAVFAASTAAGVGLLLAVAVCVTLSVAVHRKSGWKSWSFVLLVATILWALLNGAVVFKHHWLAFTPSLWVLNGLYFAALISGAWFAVVGWLKALAALFAAALVAATVALPRPPGGEGPLDTAEKWKIDVRVIDEQNQALENARVVCGAVMTWERTLGLSSTVARTTDADGQIPTWEFDEDPRLKVVICTVWKSATEGNAEYPSATQFVFSPQGGGEYQLNFQLTETAHPEVAFLTLQLAGEYEQAWFTLQFELWTEEPSGHFGSRDGPQPLQKKPWQELRGGGFAIPAELARRDLRLRYFYEGPGGSGFVPPYSEIRTISVGRIEPGTSRRVRVTIPDKKS